MVTDTEIWWKAAVSLKTVYNRAIGGLKWLVQSENPKL